MSRGERGKGFGRRSIKGDEYRAKGTWLVYHIVGLLTGFFLPSSRVIGIEVRGRLMNYSYGRCGRNY